MEEHREKTTATKSTETVKKVRPLVKALYRSAIEAKERGGRVAYCITNSLYDEIIRAMDIAPIWTENYGGLCATKRAAEPYLTRADSEGFSNVLCGYARTGIGFDAIRCETGATPPDAPDGGMAKPDFLLGSTAGCDPRFKWFQSLGSYLGAKIYCLDVVLPPLDADIEEVKQHYVRYQVEQLKGLVAFLETHTGKKMDWDSLSEMVRCSSETLRMWWECYDLRRNKPCPMPSQDHFSAMVPAYFYLGEQVALDFYRELYNECKDRVERGIGVIPEEKYRLLWGGGLPPWHTMSIFDEFQNRGAVFVREAAYFVHKPPVIPRGVTNPLEIIAWRYFLRNTSEYDRARKAGIHPGVQRLLDLIGDYSVDGIVMHISRTCRASSLGQTHYKNIIGKGIKIPIVTLESDIVDAREYSQAETRTRVESFMEMVETYRKSRSDVSKG